MTPSSFEERFDEKFYKLSGGEGGNGSWAAIYPKGWDDDIITDTYDLKDIKSFIKSELDKQRREIFDTIPNPCYSQSEVDKLLSQQRVEIEREWREKINSLLYEPQKYTPSPDRHQPLKIDGLHPTQIAIVELAKTEDIGKLTLREIGDKIGTDNKPQRIKHHIEQLKKKGLLYE